MARVQGLLEGPGSSRVLDALSYHLTLLKHSDTKRDTKNIQSTLSKSKSRKSNNRRSGRPVYSSPLFFIFYCFLPLISGFSLSQSHFFSPNGFDLGRIDCSQSNWGGGGGRLDPPLLSLVSSIWPRFTL